NTPGTFQGGESSSAAHSWAMKRDGIYYIFYVGSGTGFYVATSTDGINFAKNTQPILVVPAWMSACGNVSVYYDSDTSLWIMAFEALVQNQSFGGVVPPNSNWSMGIA